MSHEIRTPINAIIGYTQLLEMGIMGAVTPDQGAQLDRIAASGRHLLGLIDDILDLSRIEAGRLTLVREPGNVGVAVEAALALIRPQAAAKGIALSASCEGMSGAQFVGDEQRVQQVLVNLLSNAVKFTPPGGRISVECATAARLPSTAKAAGPGPWAFFAVEDTGTGIAPEMLERIFQPFVQGEGGYTRSHSGTGLGLTISRRLARLMGGDLTVDSVEGEGSQFVLWLPAVSTTPVQPEGAAGLQQTQTAPSQPPVWVATEIADVGHLMLEQVSDIVARFTASVRDNPATFPNVLRLTDVQLQDHIQTWLADLAQLLVVLGSSGGEPSEIMRDGTEIQRVISERHAAQRRRLGWDERALKLEFELLQTAIEESLTSRRPSDSALWNAQAVLAGIVRQAEQISLRAYRQLTQTGLAGTPAASANPPTS